uniref:RILP-like protein homolog n=1 Tax=Steinernema glaseri TaxID=37863 RepID=A0A1I7ZA99_9BILA
MVPPEEVLEDTSFYAFNFVFRSLMLDVRSSHILRPSWMVESPRGHSRTRMSRDRLCSPSASPSKHITVVDVYDLAASIGKDFEMLIDQFGKEAIIPIMPKVISALETLESLANFNEKENEEIIDLQKTIDRLENDKQIKMQDRMRFDLELEQVEENYKKEINDLWAMVKKLQGENKHLSSALAEHRNKESEADADSANGQGIREAEIQIIEDLRDENQRRKDELKTLQHDAEESKVEVESLHNNIEKLIRQNQELLRKNSSLQKHGRLLVQEKTEFHRRLQSVEEQNIQLRNLLNDTSRACKDLQTQKLQEDDPENAPRFTLAELREVLQEKNMLKGRVLELEEQLEQLRPASTESDRKSDIESQIRTSQSTPQLSMPPSSSAPSEDSVSEECVVYGPINREPEEKLKPWKYERKDSGVRRFFRFFYKGTYSPRRESSSTSTPVPIPAHPLGN